MSKAAAARDANLALVEAMGSKKGYDPMPPDQYLCFLDFTFRLTPTGHRMLAWLRAKTIRAKRGGRSVFARDERGELTLTHAAEDLGLSLPHVSKVMDELEELGLAKRDPERPKRILLWAQPEYDGRNKGEDGEDPPDPEDEANFYSTYKCSKRLVLFFQQLDPERRRQCLAGFGRLQEYRKRVVADAMAVAREKGQEIEDEYLSAIGYRGEEPRGRPKEDPPPKRLVQLSLEGAPDVVQITAADFVQVSDSYMHTPQNGAAQKSASLLPAEIHSETVKVSGASDPPEIPNSVERDKEPAAPDSFSGSNPPSTPLTQNPSQRGGDASNDPLADPNLVVDAVQHFFQRKLGASDPLRTKFIDLATEFEIPAASVWRFLGEKCSRKRANGYTIDSPGALYKIAVQDLPGWVQTHAREIDADWKWEQAEARQALDTQIQTLAARKEML